MRAAPPKRVPSVRPAPTVRVTIDRLVLGGVDAREARALAHALEAELGAALAARASQGAGLGAGRSVAALRLPRFSLGATSPSPRAIGARAARVIAKGIGT